MLSLNFCAIRAQTASDIKTYNWFDSKVGRSNLDFNMGVFYTNDYKVIGDNNLYLVDNKYTIGDLIFQGQNYYNLKLNYDVFRDILIVNPEGVSELIGISLNKEYVNSFKIYNKDFINLFETDYKLSELKSGYYEVSRYDKSCSLYIKHFKNIEKKINDRGAYSHFSLKNSYFLEFQKELFEINSKSNLLKVFPNQKKLINEFYSNNKELRRKDLDKFMKNLIKSISTTLSNSTF